MEREKINHKIMEMKRIITKEEYVKCIQRLEVIFDTEDEKETEKLEKLAKLIGDYEEHHYPIENINFNDAINNYLQTLLKQNKNLEK